MSNAIRLSSGGSSQDLQLIPLRQQSTPNIRIMLPDTTILERFTLLLLDPTEENCNSRRVMKVSLKILATVTSFIAQYPSVNAARQASRDPVMSTMLGIGELVSWGAVYSVASIGVIDDVFINRELRLLDRNSSSVANAVYWTSIATLSVTVQTSDIYISYVYTDHSLGWPIFVGSIFATFTLHSLHGAIQKAARTNNILTRFLYRRTSTCKIFQAKENFCSLLEDYFTDFIKNASVEERQQFLDLLNDVIDDAQKKKYYLWMLGKGLEHRIKEINSNRIYLRYAGRMIKFLGPMLYLANYYLDTKLVYNSSKLILDSNWFAAFLIFFSITPNIYLDLTMTTNTLDNIFWGIVGIVNSCAIRTLRDNISKETLLKGLGCAITGCMSFFGLGSTVTVIDDAIGFDKHRFLSVAILLFTALLVADGISELTNKVVNYLLLCNVDDNSKKQIIMVERVIFFAQKVILMPADQFEKFITNIAGELDEAVREGLIDKLAEESRFQNLRDDILAIFLQNNELVEIEPV